jgi:hypothetical protein
VLRGQCDGSQDMKVHTFGELRGSLGYRLCGLVVRVPGYRSRGPGSSWALPDFLRSSGSGKGSTMPRNYN